MIQLFFHMYLPQILQYLLWPAMILISWFAVRLVLYYFGKKFPEKEEQTE